MFRRVQCFKVFQNGVQFHRISCKLFYSEYQISHCTLATSSYTMRPLLVLRVCTSLLDGFDVLHSTNAPFDGSAAVKGFSESEPWLVWYGVVWSGMVWYGVVW